MKSNGPQSGASLWFSCGNPGIEGYYRSSNLVAQASRFSNRFRSAQDTRYSFACPPAHICYGTTTTTGSGALTTTGLTMTGGGCVTIVGVCVWSTIPPATWPVPDRELTVGPAIVAVLPVPLSVMVVDPAFLVTVSKMLFTPSAIK